MSQTAYVWQRNASPSLEAAIQRHAETVDGLTVLGAEIMRGPLGELAWIRVMPNWELLKSTELPTYAYRLGYDASGELVAHTTQIFGSDVVCPLADAFSAYLPRPALISLEIRRSG